ncbi:M3 family metallopeptidase [Fimbriimonas ginsengisoli]|uniref:Thimet oligopeptidase n=1 Tax=Fimbriimonas ginsengisoli Gsoil 348 TaxID=661478 RepID=A0A068NPD5_FIMGI|nr:M3 family metallopeptidase [Fimbriimonas ginsengisoli]AIE85316.1 Thimet oligopeptidase [Fimbriimonas ginsengisoli Gsoil 348]
MSYRIRLAMRAFTALGLGALALAASAQEVPAPISDALKRADDAVAKIVAVPDAQRNFENTLGAYDDMSTQLDRDTSLFIFMENVSTDAKERDNARAADEAVSNWGINLGKREDLFRAIKAYADTHPQLQGEQARLLQRLLRDYHRAGMDLPAEKRKQIQGIEEQINKLGIDFGQNIADDDTKVPFYKNELKGVSDNVMSRFQQSNGLYLVPLGESAASAILGYATNPDTRHRFWLAYKRRGGQRNVDVLQKMLKLRYQDATLLGYKNIADYETEPRMAKSAANVAKFYADLRPIVRKKALKDWEEFTAIKRADTHDKKATLNPWDQSYYKNLLAKQKYTVDGQKVAEYFPTEKTVAGLFNVASTLYGISFKDVTSDAAKLDLPIWHPDVKLYEVSDNATHQKLGNIYMDLFPRDGKYTHAACWSLRGHKIYSDGTVQLPLAALVCNFTKPTATQPSLLPHDEVETLFHEFGHGLHNLLSETHYGYFAGTAVERDFVEAPSQMFENWVWDPGVLSTFARHYKTNEPLPKSLLAGMVKARTLGSGLETEHQIYYGMVDQRYHTAPNGDIDTTKTGIDMLGEIELYKGQPGTMFQASFGHLVGYDAAYYGYQWSLVYAQDMFTRFEEKGLLNPEAGMYYRRKILSRGGTMDASDMLRDYLGREPKMDAYLKHLGLDPKA